MQQYNSFDTIQLSFEETNNFLEEVFSMKKLFSVLAVLFVLGTTSAFSMGIGAQGGYTVGGNAGGALTFKLDKSPLIFAVDVAFPANGFDIGVTADYWLANPKLTKTVGFYYGIGAAGAINVGGNSADIGVAGRVVGGINAFVLDRALELYAQAAWQPTFWIGGSGEGARAGFEPLCIPVNVGFRFWF